jgi:hypothetical protein
MSTEAPKTDTPFRANAGKVRLSLIPIVAKEWWARVLMFGAVKYSAHGWRRNAHKARWSETAESLERHLDSWKKGEDIDPESGLPHMAHIMCNASFMLEHWESGQGVDDRWTPGAPFNREEILANAASKLAEMEARKKS